MRSDGTNVGREKTWKSPANSDFIFYNFFRSFRFKSQVHEHVLCNFAPRLKNGTSRQCVGECESQKILSVSLVFFYTLTECNTWVSRNHPRVLQLCLARDEKRFPSESQQRSNLASEKKIFCVVPSAFLIMQLVDRPNAERSHEESDMLWHIHSQWDCGRMLFHFIFFSLLLHMKTQRRKIFLSLVSCQLSNAEDDIVWQRI